MTPASFVATLFLLFAPVQQSLPTSIGPLRNTFAVAAETVIDDAGNVDIKASDALYDGQMAQLKTAKENLANMAADDRERDVIAAANDLLFQISACHLQAKNGSASDACNNQIEKARIRMMESIGKHKSNGAWQDGPPA